MPSYCPDCGGEILGTGKFCSSCGSDLRDLQPSQQGEGRPPRDRTRSEESASGPRQSPPGPQQSPPGPQQSPPEPQQSPPARQQPPPAQPGPNQYGAPRHPDAETPPTPPQGERKRQSRPLTGGSERGYRLAIGLGLGWLVFVILGASLEAQAGTPGVSSGAAGMYALAFLSFVGSIVAMYLDLDDLDGNLWDSSPATWVVGAILLYIVAMPLYLYKRRQSVGD